MGAGQRANVIQFRLDSILKSILNETLKLSVKNTTPLSTDTSYINLSRKISSWSRELESLSRQMLGMQKSLGFQASQARHLPRNVRYSQQQSVRDRQTHVGGAQDLLDRVTHKLAVLLDTLVSPTDVDIVNRLHKLINGQLTKMQEFKELEQVLTKLQSQQTGTAVIEARPVLRPATQTESGPVDSIAVLILLLRLLQIIALGFTKGRR